LKYSLRPQNPDFLTADKTKNPCSNSKWQASKYAKISNVAEASAGGNLE